MIVLIFTLLLAGCNFSPSLESKLSDALSAMFSSEDKYREAQEALGDLERKEQILFNETMSLTQEETEELEKNVAELVSSLEERLVLIEKEESSINKAKESLTLFEDIVNDAEEGIKEDVEQLEKVIKDRYSNHAEVVTEYIGLTDVQKELYDMFLDEETDLAMLQEKVEEVNKQNQIVQDTIQIFNESTAKVNELKGVILGKLEEE